MSICKSFAHDPDLSQDLYQEFFLSLLEITDNRLEQAYKEGFIEVYCVGIINNIWKKNLRSHVWGRRSASPLYKTSNELQIDNLDIIEIEPPEYIYWPEKSEVLDFIETNKESSVNNDRFASRVFYWSKIEYKNTKRFAIASGIPYHVCLRAVEYFNEKIKNELCKK